MEKYVNIEKFKRELIDKRSFYPAIVKNALENMPVEDVVEIVRCKDCVHYEAYQKSVDFDGRCFARGCETDKYDFCNYGKQQKNN